MLQFGHGPFSIYLNGHCDVYLDNEYRGNRSALPASTLLFLVEVASIPSSLLVRVYAPRLPCPLDGVCRTRLLVRKTACESYATFVGRCERCARRPLDGASRTPASSARWRDERRLSSHNLEQPGDELRRDARAGEEG